eukprot:1149521-Pelagomonas_calceolata.AAC.1
MQCHQSFFGGAGGGGTCTGGHLWVSNIATHWRAEDGCGFSLSVLPHPGSAGLNHVAMELRVSGSSASCPHLWTILGIGTSLLSKVLHAEGMLVPWTFCTRMCMAQTLDRGAGPCRQEQSSSKGQDSSQNF